MPVGMAVGSPVGESVEETIFKSENKIERATTLEILDDVSFNIISLISSFSSTIPWHF